LLGELAGPFLQALAQGFLFAQTMLGGVAADGLGDLRGAALRDAHGAEVRGLCAFLREGFVVEGARGDGVEAEVELIEGRNGLGCARSLSRSAFRPAKSFSPVGFLAPARSASRPLPLANPFRRFPNGSNPKRLESKRALLKALSRYCAPGLRRAGVLREYAAISPGTVLWQMKDSLATATQAGWPLARSAACAAIL
jgi:hypothetical protein